jgi:hypothetical protein
MLAVRSSEDRWPSVVFNLWPGENEAKTLARQGGCGSSPGSFPRRWRRVGATRRDATSSERVGTADLVLGRWICTPAVEKLARELQKVDDSAALGQEKSRVG